MFNSACCRVDPEYELHEQQYQAIKKEILGEEEDEEEEGEGSERPSGSEESSEEEEGGCLELATFGYLMHFFRLSGFLGWPFKAF